MMAVKCPLSISAKYDQYILGCNSGCPAGEKGSQFFMLTRSTVSDCTTDVKLANPRGGSELDG